MVTKRQIEGGLLTAIGILVIIRVSAEILPSAFDTWFNVSTSNWGGGTGALWDLIPLFAVLALMLMMLGWAFLTFRQGN